jgi:hypothetical protein
MNAAGTIRMMSRPRSLGPSARRLITAALFVGLELLLDMAKSLAAEEWT